MNNIGYLFLAAAWYRFHYVDYLYFRKRNKKAEHANIAHGLCHTIGQLCIMFRVIKQKTLALSCFKTDVQRRCHIIRNIPDTTSPG